MGRVGVFGEGFGFAGFGLSGLGLVGFGDGGDAGISGALGSAGPVGDGDLPQPAAMTLKAMPASMNFDVVMGMLLSKVMLVEAVR